jgi:hypothetical protein
MLMCAVVYVFPLFLSVVPLNDKKTLEMRALSFDRDDELGEPGLEEVLKAKKPKDLRRGNYHLSTFLSAFALYFHHIISLQNFPLAQTIISYPVYE